jgi:hypothetical protein
VTHEPAGPERALTRSSDELELEVLCSGPVPSPSAGGPMVALRAVVSAGGVWTSPAVAFAVGELVGEKDGASDGDALGASDGDALGNANTNGGGGAGG